MSNVSAPLYLYLDLETPGLDPKMGILEVAWFVTPQLDAVQLPVHSALVDTDLAVAAQVANDYVRKMHTDSGLWDDLSDETKPKLRIEDIEDLILGDIKDHSGPVYLVGNSIRFDRALIEEWMPRLDEKLHYRQVDLTSVRLFLEGFDFDTYREASPELVAHRAKDDIINSADYADHLGTLIILGRDRVR